MHLPRHIFAALAFLTLLAPGSLAHAQDCGTGDLSRAVMGNSYCLVVKTLASNSGGPLVVLLHGDMSRGGPATYHYKIAGQLAEKHPDATVVAMIRPGYDDGEGRKSDGNTNNRRDHYTDRNIDSVAAAIGNLRAHYSSDRVILIGHSGGAAYAGVIAGRHPNLVNGVGLISCPCNIPVWRAGRHGGTPWPNSLSPADFASRIAPTTRVFALTGARDDNTRPSLARDYIAQVAATGAEAKFIEVPGASHRLNGTMREGVLPRLSELIRN